MSNVPKLDNRDSDKLLREVKELARQYTPEWNFDENSSDFGVVFSKIFCAMMENTISKYNKTSYNHYLTFLNMLGVNLKPAAPASGMIVAKALRSSEGVYIDKGTQLYADSENEDNITYETVDSLSIIDTGIKSICFTDYDSDFIGYVYNQPENVVANDDDEENKIKPFKIFDNVLNENKQSHEIYFCDDIVFNMARTDVKFEFLNKLSANRNKELPEIFSDRKNAVWEYYNGKKWVPADKVEKVGGLVRVKFDGITQKTGVMGERGRYLRCKFKKVPEGGIRVTDINYNSASKNLSADFVNMDDTELDNKEFYPFGEEYNMYNIFTIACEEAFTKVGATVEVNADLQFAKVKTDLEMPGKIYKHIMTDVDFADLKPDNIKIEKIIWEYWNGEGWAHLKCDEEAKNFFKVEKENMESEDNVFHRSFKFECPKDIQPIGVGSKEAHFIRAKISKMNNQYDYYANYISPFVKNISFDYKFENVTHEVRALKVVSDLQEKEIEISNMGMTSLMENTICNCPAMYMCLKRPLPPGMIRIFVDIEEGIHRFNPTLKWEYFADDGKGGAKWKHIDTVDLTDNFSHSEMVTIIGKDDFKETELFGSKGYYLRIINPDKKYAIDKDIARRPIINNIKFNAVRIVQINTCDPEYFSIEADEEDKICEISSPNVSKVSVWVNEFGSISTNEQEEFLKMSKKEVLPEYDEYGKLEALWIKWKEVPNLIAHGPNDRVYEMDYYSGKVQFGNGRNGKIPTEQYNESIRIDYAVCNGTRGNLEPGGIEGFVESIREVSSVTNEGAIIGGVDMETVDNAASRMFGQVSGGNRVVSLSDFEDTIKYNDRNIYRVKCLSHVDEYDTPALGVTSIAVLPCKFMQGYEKFQGIKNHIWQLLDEKAPATLSNSPRLRIFEVRYVETCVSVDIVIDDFNAYQGVYSEIESKLKEFLNPITGNFSKKGWEIGEFPRKEFIYNYIKVIPNIKWIKSVNIFTKIITPEGKKEIDFENVKKQHFVVPIYGTPEINITVD